MSESFIQVAPDSSGKKAHTNQRTIGANNVEDEYTLPGEYPLASYTISNGTSVAPAANDHLLQIMAGGSLKVRIRRLRVEQAGNAAAAAALSIEVWRLTTAGTGGTALTPRPFDPSDAASGATAMTLPTAKGTEGVLLMRTALLVRQAILTTAAQPDDGWEWTQHPNTPPIIINSGTTNGIAIKATSASTGTFIVYAEITETSF